MSDPVPRPTGWVLPVLLAVATAAALGFGFLYAVRPNAGELGAIRVVVADDAGTSGNTIHIVVAEAPLVQKDTVSPGSTFAGQVNYPTPYLIPPHLKLTGGKRQYKTLAETERGFAWAAVPLPDDLRGDGKGDTNLLDQLLGGTLDSARLQGKVKPGLVLEDFAWEAKGPRAPLSAIPPKPFEQTGTFLTVVGQEGVVFFPVPYASPPTVEMTGLPRSSTIIADCTAKSFKWKNVGKDSGFTTHGDVTWTAKGVVGAADGK